MVLPLLQLKAVQRLYQSALVLVEPHTARVRVLLDQAPVCEVMVVVLLNKLKMVVFLVIAESRIALIGHPVRALDQIDVSNLRGAA